MNPYLITGLALTPSIFLDLSRRVSSVADQRPDPDRFTLREVIAHMVDWEIVFRQRMQHAVSSDRPTIVPYDESERAAEYEYHKQDFLANLAKFEQERLATTQWLQSLSSEEMERVLVHPERGEFTVRQHAEMMLGHDVYHIAQFAEALEIAEKA